MLDFDFDVVTGPSKATSPAPSDAHEHAARPEGSPHADPLGGEQPREG